MGLRGEGGIWEALTEIFQALFQAIILNLGEGNDPKYFGIVSESIM
jgi:hypothetical protein